jgi:hypothetical protein
VTNRIWDVILFLAALFAAVTGARYYVVAVLDGDRLLARLAAGAFFLFTIAAVVLWFWFW